MSTDDAAGRAADAQQAAYFRAELHAERQHLLTGINKRRAIIDRPSEAGRQHRAAVHSAEAQVRYLDRLIAHLDRRFAAEMDDQH